ncbi:uncharacterized protein LOC111401528 [Olea europaea var. sylvestris]|uniref:uncharacterized protein LOC111401528 n=1 Tax=Olea europaea var. sylvestris TaxID=158386 RepID=UPI000C1D021F|nr:uncharacterized protein LOC111401528 [Olea europaea var. sylvestris]
MGCFLACFGFKKKRKRRKPGNKNLSGEEGHGKYMPLDSDVTVKLDTKPEPITSDSKLKENQKDEPKLKIKKKVSFNLNVKAYEPIQNYDAYLSEGEEETNLPVLRCDEDSLESSIRSYPQNYRYQKCIEGYDDEDDEIKLEESDFYYDDIYDSCEELEDDYSNNESDDLSKIQEDSSWQLNSADMKSNYGVTNFPMPFHDVSNKDFQRLESNCHTRDRSVLNPVENLTQWKAIKAQARSQFKRQKENIMVEKEQEIPSTTDPSYFPKAETNFATISQLTVPVDASLSNWLVSTQKL